MLPAVEQLEDRLCPTSPADMWVARYAGLTAVQRREQADDVRRRADALVAESLATQQRTGWLERGYDMLRATDRLLRLERLHAQAEALTRLQRGR